jgi:hypothetical protein
MKTNVHDDNFDVPRGTGILSRLAAPARSRNPFALSGALEPLDPLSRKARGARKGGTVFLWAFGELGPFA